MSLNIYNPTTQQLTEVAGLDVKDSLEKVATLPTPTADYLNQVYILVGTQEGYHVGSIYQCRYINSAYTWVEITGSVVGKADKAPNATNNHLAKLTADGNLADSGIAVSDLGTAINKNWTDLVRPNSHDLVESNAVYSAITNAISSIYTPHGDITCAELVPALLIEENIGNVYTVTDSGTTTAYFMQGAGKTINAGDSVSIIKAGADAILFNLMGNVLDLIDYQKKNLTTAIEIGGVDKTTVEDALNGLNDHEEEDIEGVYKANGVLGAKNLIPFPYTDGFSKTMNGITFVVNSDGSVTANGTATNTSHFSLCQSQLDLEDGTYILTGDMDEETSYNKTSILFNENDASGASHWNYGKDAPCEFTQNGWKVSELRIRITSGVTVDNQTFYPMIRLASITDDTYVPYAKTNQQLTTENQTLTNNVDVLFEAGVKNICPPYLGSYSANGITYIGNSDGTVTANGTCSENVGTNIRVYLKAGQYKVSGCPSGGSYSTYRIGVTTDTWTLIGTHDFGNGTTITISSDGYYRINLDVREGYVANNLVFKPMITDIDTPESDYDHYVPYAMTNKQITDVIPSDASANNKLVAKSSIKSVQVPIANVAVNSGSAPHYYVVIATGIPTTATVIGIREGNPWDENITSFSISAMNSLIIRFYGSSSYTIPSTRQPITIYYIE